MNAQTARPAGDTGAIAVLSWAWAAVAVAPAPSPVAWSPSSNQVPRPERPDVRSRIACAS